MRSAAIAALTALLLAGSAGASTSGLRGLVVKGPITPVCREGIPCTAPAKHTTLTFVRQGESHSVTTGSNGRYAIQLDPGTWTVRIANARFGYRPRTAVVVAGLMRVQNFSIDTGIR